MELQEEKIDQKNYIQSLHSKYIIVKKNQKISMPCLITGEKILCQNEQFDLIKQNNLIKTLQSEKIEILLIGSNKTMDFNHPLSRFFSIEQMNLQSACYSFNVVLSEHRRCALYLKNQTT